MKDILKKVEELEEHLCNVTKDIGYPEGAEWIFGKVKEIILAEQKETATDINVGTKTIGDNMLSINEFVKEVGENAIAHGWREEERSFGELIALCHSELSEALEEYRKGKKPTDTYYICKAEAGSDDFVRCNCGCSKCKHGKPEGIPSELADVVIRICDMCHHYGIDLEQIMLEKHEFNKSRPYKHGGKVM